MFQVIALYALLVVFSGVLLHWAVFPCSRHRQWGIVPLIRTAVHMLTMFFLPQDLSLIGKLKKLVYMVGLLCFVFLFVTSFGPRLICDTTPSGLILMAHATFAPVFMICAAVAVFGYAQQMCFDKSDQNWLIRFVTFKWEDILANADVGRKLTFWAAAVLALPVALSMIASMYPVFGTDGQHLLFEIHRYMALLMTLVMIIHVYLVMRYKFKTD